MSDTEPGAADTPASVRIRRAGPADAAAIAPLFDAYRRFYARTTDPALAERFLRERLDGQESVIFVAERDAEPVGFVQLYPSFDSVEAAPVWLLHDLFVAPACRRAGVARALMEAARDMAEATGACGLSLATAIDNMTAQALYEGLGYIRDTRFYHYFLPLRR